MMATIAVIDYGMGNLKSVSKALMHVAPRHHVVVTDDAKTIQDADRVVFPGQGAMPDCMRELDARGLRDVVIESARTKPFLGICIGLQMLFEHSEEGDTAGLGLLKGQVKRFDSPLLDTHGQKLKVPHMGWNTVTQSKPHALWSGIENATRFYHVHSYYAAPIDIELETAYSEYPMRFTTAVGSDNIFAVQFHAEKSADAGLQILRNFIDWQP